MAQRFRLAAAVTAVAITATTFVGVANAFPGAPTAKPLQKQRANVPSAHEVNTAKLSPASAKEMRKTLETQLTQTSLTLNSAQANAQLAWDALSAAQQRAVQKGEEAAEAKRQLEAARKAEKRASKDLGRIASETYRNGGIKVGPAELLTAEDPQELLNRSDVLRHLSDARARDLTNARNATELASQWDAYAQATAHAAEKALGEQTDAETKAQKVATETRVTVLQATADQNELLDRLADLNGTSRSEEEKAFQKREDERLQREFEAAQAAQREEEARAQAEAARAEAERQAAEQASSVVDGIERPENVIEDEADDAVAGEIVDGPSDEELAEAQRQAEEEAARVEAEREAAEQAERERVAEEKRKQLEAEQAEAAKKAAEARKAQEDAKRKAEEAQQAERERLEREAAERAEAAKKAEEARKAAEKKAAEEAARAEAERKAAEKRAAEKKAAEKRAAEKRAAEKKAKEEAAKKAAAKKKAKDAKKKVASAGTGKQAALNWALNIANSSGYGYVFGANGPRYFDCSSFVQNAFRQSGISTQRVASAQFTGAPQQVNLKNLQVGDLVFSSNNGAPSGIYHVAIYIGNGQVVHARNPRAGISVTPISYVNNIYPLAARY
ncbi:NlpC/P60 family protein [Pseudoglutamicibacter cumminsii]|uniref:C40 family peptidase n=1 Tax=Pseudoglutamicibacter cumminsii TaxID=156979 RepID=UPI00195855AD|nr:C40 family peptidase [Pseudoglutamicibacter cumminsii]MBM7796046.1 cell wall-associated NlpC family hydrolase [Pseudoglutamicibacter cumminsii]